MYWSSQLSYLHPSTVVGPDSDDQYILVQLDDGDSRDVHIDQVRYLPDNYPIVGEFSVIYILKLSSNLSLQIQPWEQPRSWSSLEDGRGRIT